MAESLRLSSGEHHFNRIDIIIIDEVSSITVCQAVYQILVYFCQLVKNKKATTTRP